MRDLIYFSRRFVYFEILYCSCEICNDCDVFIKIKRYKYKLCKAKIEK